MNGFQRHGNLLVSVLEGTAYVDGTLVNLSMQEYSMLLYIMQHMGEVLSANHLARTVHGVLYSERAVYTLMSRLRKKIESGPEFVHIVTVPGGYVMPEEVEE